MKRVIVTNTIILLMLVLTQAVDGQSSHSKNAPAKNGGSSQNQVDTAAKSLKLILTNK